jgi:hypothetical protein
MKKECTGWLAEVEAAQPSVVIRAHAPGSSTSIADVRVSIDDKEVAARLDGAAILVDPGEHRFHFARASDPPVDRVVLIGEGEKLKPIEIEIGTLLPPPSASAKPIWPVFALGGVGIASIGVFAILGATGSSRYNELQSTCAPNCSPEDTDALKTQFVVGDVMLGVGIAALAGSAIYYFATRRSDKAPAHARILPTARGLSVAF